MGVRGDIVIAISTSGNSRNVIEAVRLAKRTGMITFGFTGQAGGELAKLVDYWLGVASDDTPRIQECHITAGHIVCGIVEQELFG